MSRRGFTLPEVLVTAALLAVLIGALVGGLVLLGKQTRTAMAHLDQLDDVYRLEETIRADLAAIVLNPFVSPELHENNSFVISGPNKTSIQFVTQRPKSARADRLVVSYDARPSADGDHLLRLTRTAWTFKQPGTWNTPISFPGGWPEEWIGPVVARDEAKYAHLRLRDIRWEHLPPAQAEGRTFFRVRLVVLPPGTDAPLVFTQLVGAYTPDLASRVTNCPCAFAPCFDPRSPDCGCCNRGGGR